MKSKSSIPIVLLVYVVTLVLAAGSPAHAQSFGVIHNFAGTDGSGPLSGLAINSKELYGTASGGGQYGGGVAFKSTLTGTLTVLHSFGNGTDGSSPEGSLIIGKGGYLYGTTFSGGTANSGTVFKLSSKGVETVLYNFAGGADGANPIAGLAIDKNENLYGTTSSGGAFNEGTVFEVSSTGVHTVLYSFGTGANDGSDPVAGVTFDTAGNLYGTTATGGAYGNGSVFELSPSSPAWTETILYSFEMQDDGGTPYAGLIFDHAGNLYGAATDGGAGGSNGGGTVFELTPSGDNWNFQVLYGLTGWGISGTFRDLLYDAHNDTIYATTHCDGSNDAGTVYELVRSGETWSYTQLYTFTGGTDGLYSFSNLVIDTNGNLYGTTNQGGANQLGVIFKVTP